MCSMDVRPASLACSTVTAAGMWAEVFRPRRVASRTA